MKRILAVAVGALLLGMAVTSVFAQEFGPVATNTYVVKFLDPNGPLPQIGGEFDPGWAATLNDGTKWLIFTEPENDQDPENGPRSEDFHFYCGIRDGKPPRFYMGIIGTGFSPSAASDAPTENDAASWWGSSLYEFQITSNFEEDPQTKLSIGYDGHWSDFQREPALAPADFNLTNLEVAIITQIDNGFAAELAFDMDDVALLSLDEPDPTTGITYLRVIVSIQGPTGTPLVVWPDGDFNGNVNYLTHGSTGWDHFGWFDVTTQRRTPVRWQVGAPVPNWDLY
jgi:hypothetical protein